MQLFHPEQYCVTVCAIHICPQYVVSECGAALDTIQL